jgi:hypothetical protein
MSYILEALRKMDKQRKLDSADGSWVESLTAEPEEEKEETHRPVRWLVAASIFFGLAGIITGFVLYSGSQIPDKEPSPTVQERKAPPQPERTAAAPEVSALPSASSRSEEAQPLDKAPPKPRPKVETQALTVSEIKAALVAKEESQEVKKAPEAKVVPPEPVPSAPGSPLRQDKVIDLTGRYRLSSTGEVNQRKYATLERNDYIVGDEFMGMILTAIEKDRVHLKGKADGQRYVIRFGYR